MRPKHEYKKTITFNQIGFPIKLINCPHILVEGELVPDVNYEQLEELMFIRLHFCGNLFL